MNKNNILQVIKDYLQPYKLNFRGVVNKVELMPNKNCKSIVLIGNIGGDFFTVFERQKPATPNPLDDWVKSILNPLADDLGGVAYYPSDKPYQPFLQWAKQAEPVFTTPLGLMAHPKYGFWHAYRGAIGLNYNIEFKRQKLPIPNIDKKSLYQACPVRAFSENGYDIYKCIDYIQNDASKTCFNGGCLSRHALTLGEQYDYSTKQHQFHMQAFVESHK